MGYWLYSSCLWQTKSGTELTYPAPLQLVVFISGNGSNLQAIIEAIQTKQLDAKIIAVISDNDAAYGLTRATSNHIPTYVISRNQYSDKTTYEAALIQVLQQLQPDLVALAGYMRILSPNLLNKFDYRFINIHPSLLPNYPGLNTHQKVLDNADSEHGCSIHLVTANVDEGPIIAQVSFKIAPGEMLESLQQRVHKAEHFLYPTILNWFAHNRILIKESTVYFDQVPLPASGFKISTQ